VYVKAEIYHDGGAYASRTPAMVGNAGTIGIGPYDVPNIAIDTWGIYTNNPPCGVVRGFGSVQAAFVAELPGQGPRRRRSLVIRTSSRLAREGLESRRSTCRCGSYG
jgi:Molybdopterin cofactor-binding domain